MLNFDDLKRLAGVNGPCLTVFQPLHEDYPLSVKQLTCIMSGIQKADKELGDMGIGPDRRGEMLRPLIKVASHTDWTGRKGSLVMFRAPDCTVANFWPDSLAPRVHYAHEFFILPLLSGLAGMRNFWLLILSINEVRLFRGSIQGLTEIPVPLNMPTGFANGEKFEKADHGLRARSTAGRSMGSMKGAQFGTSAERECRPAWTHDLFKQVDRDIHPTLAADPQPLILAGVTRDVSMYRELTTWRPLVAGAIHGSQRTADPRALLPRAIQLLTDHAAHSGDTFDRDMESAASRGLFLTDPAELIGAARCGRIDTLFISPEGAGFVANEELINSAALATIRNSGSVNVLHGMRLAEGCGAVLRFCPVAEPTDKMLPELAFR